MPRIKPGLILAVSLTIAFAIALLLDSTIARFVHDSGLGHFVEGKRWAQVIKEPGEFRFTCIVIGLLLITRQIRGKQALFVLLAGVISGANTAVKWFAGRTRPYKLPGMIQPRPFDLQPFWHGFWGLIHQKDLCFPSGHETTAGALAVAVWLVWPKGRWIFVLLAAVVGIERIAENAHYASDVIGAAGFALLAIPPLHRAMDAWMKTTQPRGFEVVLPARNTEPAEKT